MSWTGACRSNTPDKRAGARNIRGSSFVFDAQLTFITASALSEYGAVYRLALSVLSRYRRSVNP